MKRYRGKNANYQRLGSAFVPAYKWGKRFKREKREIAKKFTDAYMDAMRNPLYSPLRTITPTPSYDEIAALMALVGPAEHKPMVTADGREVHQYIWTPEPWEDFAKVRGI